MKNNMKNEKSEVPSMQKISDVTSVISHQLKTPLAGIKSSLEILSSGDLGPLNKEQQEYVELTLGSAGKMISLVRDLLDASRIDENRFVLSPGTSDIAELVGETIKELGSFAQAKNTRITLNRAGTIPPLMIDGLKVRQVISNILYNAIRYNRFMAEQKKILLIEDDKFLLKLYSDKLVREGYTVSMAITGEEGLGKVKQERPDLVFLDIILPQKNGFDVLREIKGDPEIKNIPVVILTNLGQESDIKTGMDLGASDYLVKTDFSITKLPEIVRKILPA